MSRRHSRLHRLFLGCIALAAALALLVPPALALVNATGVALSVGADCATYADLDITFTSDAAPTHEYGLITNKAGAALGEFLQSTWFQNWSGTYVGYGMPIGPDQPEGTLIGSYAWVGENPPSAATTGEFFVAYECSDVGASNVVYTCAGPYGTCPRTAADYLASLAPGSGLVPGCEVLMDIPAGTVGGAFIANAPVYWAPGQLALPAVTIPVGNTARVIGLDASGQYYKIIWACDYLWVPANTLGPNYDRVWNGAPLPTQIVD